MRLPYHTTQGNRILISEALRRQKSIAGSIVGVYRKQMLDFGRAKTYMRNRNRCLIVSKNGVKG
jgi:hypothetical protein